MFKFKYRLVRNIAFSDLIETFLVFSVLSIVAIRVFLNLTGFPQLGGNGLHIAHMLWGGLIMLIVIGAVLIFINVEVKKFAAVFGGIGFGVFIDEIGKFVTSDNNYFFEPTFSLIYIVLATFYIVAHTVESHKKPTQEEYLINAVEYLKGALTNGISRADRKKALEYLSKSDGQNRLTRDIRGIFEDIKVIKSQKPNIITSISSTLERLYARAIRWRWFGGLLVSISVLSILFNFFAQIGLVFEAVQSFLSGTVTTGLNTSETISLLVNLTVSFLIFLGALKIRKSRLEAYDLFKKAFLIDIFLGQIFLFYTNQLLALIGLVVKITILEALNYMISQEVWKKENNKA